MELETELEHGWVTATFALHYHASQIWLRSSRRVPMSKFVLLFARAKGIAPRTEGICVASGYVGFYTYFYACLLYCRSRICRQPTYSLFIRRPFISAGIILPFTRLIVIYPLSFFSTIFPANRIWPPQRSRIFMNPPPRFLLDSRATLLPSMPSSSMRTCNQRIMRLLEQIQSLSYCSSTLISLTRQEGNPASAMF